MNLISSALWAVAQPFLTWAFGFFTRKVVMVATSIASFVFLTAAFIVCLKYILLTALTLVVVPPWLVTSLGMFVPFNFIAILSSIISAQSCRWAYDKAIDKIKLINSAT